MHSFPGGLHFLGGDSPTLVAYAVDSNNTLTFHKEPEHPRIKLPDMPQFKKPIAKRFGQGLPMTLPVPEFGESGYNSSKVIRNTDLQFVQKFPHWTRPRICLIKFYGKSHNHVNTNIDVQKIAIETI